MKAQSNPPRSSHFFFTTLDGVTVNSVASFSTTERVLTDDVSYFTDMVARSYNQHLSSLEFIIIAENAHIIRHNNMIAHICLCYYITVGGNYVRSN